MWQGDSRSERIGCRLSVIFVRLRKRGYRLRFFMVERWVALAGELSVCLLKGSVCRQPWIGLILSH